MLSIPVPQYVNFQEDAINQSRPQYFYEDSMTLKDYIQQKNVQRKLQFKLLNVQYKVPTALSEEKEYEFQRQVHDIKGFFKHITGEGSLFNKFSIMIDNLYLKFMQQINVYHKLKFERQIRIEDTRMKEFRQANSKLTNYLKSCQLNAQQVQQRLEHIKRTRQLYNKQREIMIEAKKKQMRQKQQEEKQLKKKEKRQSAKKKRQEYLNVAVQEQLQKKRIEEQKKQQQIDRKKRIQEEKQKRKQNIGKLSNVFASFLKE